MTKMTKARRQAKNGTARRATTSGQNLAPARGGHERTWYGRRVETASKKPIESCVYPPMVNEWTETQTLDYLDDLIERNSEALNGLAKL